MGYVYVRVGNSPRPRVWILERSKDFGQTWSPWQYFADTEQNCVKYFGIKSNTPITQDDSVTCTTEHSKILPLQDGEIPISIINIRPSAKHYFDSTVLQEWTKATNLRLRFLKTNFEKLRELMPIKKEAPIFIRSVR